jgi:uncharacterized coiled-coil protein SlyX
MADFCKSPPKDDLGSILSLLPNLEVLQKLSQYVAEKYENIQQIYKKKIDKLIDRFSDVCPSYQELQQITTTRNNLVTQVNKIYAKINNISNTVGITLQIVNGTLLIIGVSQAIIGSLNTARIISPIPLPDKVGAVVDKAEDIINKLRFKKDGEPRIINVYNGLNSLNVTLILFSNALRIFICSLEALDVSLLNCFKSIPEGKKPKLTPLNPEVIAFAETSAQESTESVLGVPYKGFIFEIEEVPFTPTVNRKRANALNKDGIVLLQTELSFTTRPEILIQELKLIIDRDNLKAN